MKKKIVENEDDNKPVTRRELEGILDEKLDEKLEEKLRDYPTISKVEEIIERKLDEKLENYPTKFEIHKLELRIDDKARLYRDEVLTKLDYLIGKYEKTEEDSILAKKKDEDLERQIDNHEKRISALENNRI